MSRVQIRFGLVAIPVLCSMLVLFAGSPQQTVQAQEPRHIHPEELKNEGAIQKMCPECKGVHHGHSGHDDYYKRQHALPSIVDAWMFLPLLLGILLISLALVFRKKKGQGDESLSST